jgi:hypothetical protein
MAPDYEQNVAFEFAQFGGIVNRTSVTLHSVTECNIRGWWERK